MTDDEIIFIMNEYKLTEEQVFIFIKEHKELCKFCDYNKTIYQLIEYIINLPI